MAVAVAVALGATVAVAVAVGVGGGTVAVGVEAGAVVGAGIEVGEERIALGLSRGLSGSGRVGELLKPRTKATAAATAAGILASLQ